VSTHSPNNKFFAMNETEEKPKKRYKKPKSEEIPWKPILMVKIYKMLRAGMSKEMLCKEMGITRKTLWNWSKRYEGLEEAMELAEKERQDSKDYLDWVYERLSPGLKELWNKIGRWEKEKNGLVKIEMLLADQGKGVRQQLFLHAMCVKSFSPTAALKMLCISKRELDRWITEDMDFAELIKEIQWHKANFFEQSLVQLVKEGNTAAILFANKTVNRDRGYGTHSSVDVNVSGEITHGIMDLGDLLPYLAESTRLDLFAAIRKKEAEKTPRVLTLQEVVQEKIVEAGQAEQRT
jgi:Homeodomain-like domain